MIAENKIEESIDKKERRVTGRIKWNKALGEKGGLMVVKDGIEENQSEKN